MPIVRGADGMITSAQPERTVVGIAVLTLESGEKIVIIFELDGSEEEAK